jgi:hypothetical protein
MFTLAGMNGLRIAELDASCVIAAWLRYLIDGIEAGGWACLVLQP